MFPKTDFTESIIVSFTLGVYSNQLCDKIKKNIDEKIPTKTALFAAFLPSHSERMSVIRKVTAKSTFPKVCSIPNAFISNITSTFARIVATAERQ